MSFAIDSTELIYLALGPGALLLGAWLLRLDLRLHGRHAALIERVMEAEGQLATLLEARSRERELEERVALLSRQQEQLMLRDAEIGPYLRAIGHAQNGAGTDALVESTGVTRAEAEFIVALHARASGTVC